MKLRIFTSLTILSLFFSIHLGAQESVAREWNELILTGIRNDFARPTVHARNLWHTSMAMYDAWAAYDDVADTYLLGNTVGDFTCEFTGVPIPTDPEDLKAAREEAISYAVFRLYLARFLTSPGAGVSIPAAYNFFLTSGYDPTFTDTDYTTGNPAALGNYIAQCIIDFGLQDGSNEQLGYVNQAYEPVNPPLVISEPGNPTILDLNHWQPITLDSFVDQSGNPIGASTPAFLGPEWGQVEPFSLGAEDLNVYTRDGFDYLVYHDPGDPCYIDTMVIGGLSEEYKWNHSMVAVWSGHLDPSDGVMIDISPGALGNLSVSDYPTDIPGLQNFYDYLEGGDPSIGRDLNPSTGLPYEPQIVPRGDYGRILAEFWADGPNSETPPGHWFTILNYVNDYPGFEKRYEGTGDILDDLEWDVKAYFTLAGAMHDVAITAWGIKGWYDYVRPVSAIRGMCERGQSSDPNLPSYDEGGILLVPGHIELIESGDPLAGDFDENVGKIKILAWKGPDFITDPDVDEAGVGWILGAGWYPYQRPTFVTPPFAGYISGHSTFSRAAAEVMTMLTGDPFFPGGMGVFDCPQNEFLVFEEGPSMDIELQWATYRDASDQCSLSRIWGGIHPPVDDMPGRLIGMLIGPEAFELAKSYFYDDADFDGYYNYQDCDDNDPTIYPGAPELCDNKDNDCNGEIDDAIPYFTYYFDGDGDGFGDAAVSIEICELVAPQDYVDNDLDCDDNNNTINPDAVEVCDEVDNNCNGMVDDGLTVLTYYQDLDNDTYGNPDVSIDTCGFVAPVGFVSTGGDCNDNDNTIYPGADEPNDGIDNDCNGIIDDFVSTSEYMAEGWDMFPNPVRDMLIVKQDFFVNGTYRILTVEGRLIRTGDVSFINGQAEISFQDVPDGIYMVQFFNDQDVRKFIGKVVRF
ncbi:MAG: T9SS type A sorting domain-containing protein [Saprospiraceae bacterium]|nr:T9SS type A sorting domain-containing protein [Saprospiraceae bacterium]